MLILGAGLGVYIVFLSNIGSPLHSNIEGSRISFGLLLRGILDLGD